MRTAIEANDRVFPYTNILSAKSFTTPDWVKYLNYESYKLKDTKDVIMYFHYNDNYKSLNLERVPTLILNDVDTEILTPF